jgi:hypothetical protein
MRLNNLLISVINDIVDAIIYLEKYYCCEVAIVFRVFESKRWIYGTNKERGKKYSAQASEVNE